VQTVHRLCEFYPGICLTTEEKARKNLSQGRGRMPIGTMNTEYTEQSIQTKRIHKFNNKNTELAEQETNWQRDNCKQPIQN
jgi:hypothetical protein